jgi:outer membrane protein assembly factor BamB
MPYLILRVAPIFFLLAALPLIAYAENWPHWRGPNLNGSSAAKNLPTEWSTTENVKWKAPMPGASGATPILWEDRVYVSSLDNRTKDLVAICLDRNTGEVRWQQTLGIGFSDEGRGKNMASPSPVTDGERVFFLFGSTDLAALDTEGNVLWKKNLEQEHGKFDIMFGFHSSPLLYDGKLYVAVNQRDRSGNEVNRKSFLLALDPATGKEIFKHIRPNTAPDETQEAYTVPIPFEAAGRKEILIFGGEKISGHDPDTGDELWRWGTWNPKGVGHWRVVPSPVTYKNLVYVCAPKDGPVFAVRAGGEGELDDSWIEWKSEEATSDVCVPLVYKDRLYVLNGDGRKDLYCIEPLSGEVIWKGELGGKVVYRASPTGADDKIYVINEEGDVAVVGTGDKFEILNRIEMGEALCRSTIIAADGNLLIRTAENLYCVGK